MFIPTSQRRFSVVVDVLALPLIVLDSGYRFRVFSSAGVTGERLSQKNLHLAFEPTEDRPQECEIRAGFAFPWTSFPDIPKGVGFSLRGRLKRPDASLFPAIDSGGYLANGIIEGRPLLISPGGSLVDWEGEQLPPDEVQSLILLPDPIVDPTASMTYVMEGVMILGRWERRPTHYMTPVNFCYSQSVPIQLMDGDEILISQSGVVARAKLVEPIWGTGTSNRIIQPIGVPGVLVPVSLPSSAFINLNASQMLLWPMEWLRSPVEIADSTIPLPNTPIGEVIPEGGGDVISKFEVSENSASVMVTPYTSDGTAFDSVSLERGSSDMIPADWPNAVNPRSSDLVLNDGGDPYPVSVEWSGTCMVITATLFDGSSLVINFEDMENSVSWNE